MVLHVSSPTFLTIKLERKNTKYWHQLFHLASRMGFTGWPVAICVRMSSMGDNELFNIIETIIN